MARDRNLVPETPGLAQLLKLLEEEGRNQKKLGEETKIPQSVISDIVNRRRLPSLEQALVFEELGIPPSAWKVEPAEPTGTQGAA
jgi:plasmid maintenance system antidote protein VapI